MLKNILKKFSYIVLASNIAGFLLKFIFDQKDFLILFEYIILKFYSQTHVETVTTFYFNVSLF